MDHAVGAFLIFADAIRIPIGCFHQLGIGLGVTFAQQIARALPAEDSPRRVAPRCAFVRAVTREKVEEQARLEERPFLAAIAALEDIAEQLLRLRAVEEVLLIGRRARKHSPARP